MGVAAPRAPSARAVTPEPTFSVSIMQSLPARRLRTSQFLTGPTTALRGSRSLRGQKLRAARCLGFAARERDTSRPRGIPSGRRRASLSARGDGVRARPRGSSRLARTREEHVGDSGRRRRGARARRRGEPHRRRRRRAQVLRRQRGRLRLPAARGPPRREQPRAPRPFPEQGRARALLRPQGRHGGARPASFFTRNAPPRRRRAPTPPRVSRSRSRSSTATAARTRTTSSSRAPATAPRSTVPSARAPGPRRRSRRGAPGARPRRRSRSPR